ncbi:MAG TPA: phosphatase PAP2 family protein, partial [Clostridia bacterium]|nr:phosphatase PAP2 family protein [Clostridia bacterium]
MTFVPGSVLQWGLQIVMWLQQFAWLAPVMKALSFLGTEDFFVALVPLVYWCISVEAGIDLALVLFSVNGVNGLLKLAFHAPRPYWISLDVRGLATEASYGLPSGHAAIASSCWPLMARRLRRTWALWSAVILVLLISLSRIFLGVHFPTDVLGGLVVGIGVLVLYETLGRPLVAKFRHATLGVQMAWSVIVPAVLLLLTWGVQSVIAHIADPTYPLWMVMNRMPDDPRDWSGFVSTAGLLGGCLAGLAFQQRHARFSVAGPVMTRALRFMVGIVGVLLIWRGLAVVLPQGTGLLAQIGRFVRYALTGIWTVFLAPVIFLRTGLARPPHDDD